MKLRFLSRLLAVATLALLAVNARAYDIYSDGIYYNVLSEKDRAVEVTANSSTFGYSGEISIPENIVDDGITYTVISIGDNAFRNNNFLTGIEFPASLISIGNEAFSGCQLTNMDFSGTSLKSIGNKAFSNCWRLCRRKVAP